MEAFQTINMQFSIFTTKTESSMLPALQNYSWFAMANVKMRPSTTCSDTMREREQEGGERRRA